MKTYKELMASTKCPPGTRYDPKLKQCVAKKIRYKGRYIFVPKNTDVGNGNGNGNVNGNGNGNGNGGNGNGGNGNGNGGNGQ